MSQALSKYNALYESMRSRRRRPELPKGLDRKWAHASLRLRHRKEKVSWLRQQAELIDAMSASIRGHSEAALDEAVRETRELIIRGRADEQAVRRGLGLVREVARRETGEEPFIVQMMAAMALVRGRIVEMVTGEGKTLTGSVAAPLIAWRRRHLHVFTVNDYLAERDARSRSRIYTRCGLACGAITQEMDPAERAEVYRLPIVYGTPKQITADWLRDQIRLGPISSAWMGRQMMAAMGSTGAMVPGLRAAMVDEADAVLIDEGVVPLIIAQARREDDMAQVYAEGARIAELLDEGPDYKVEYVRKRTELGRRGVERVRQLVAELSDPIWNASRRAEELIRNALVARHCYLRGHHYQVVDGQVVIVDEYTGRFLPDRSWEHGLHQAVEAKEGLQVTADRQTLARLSFQRFFRSYPFLCGMTGTIADSAIEMEQVYERPVTVMPTNRPLIREQWPMRVFKSAEGKFNAIVEEIRRLYAVGRPILVGTRSIEVSELISQRLEAQGLTHQVLNANFDQEEAGLIAKAGRVGAITVATNMAGRGTDILLEDKACELGGLHVILSEMHSASRIDRQFVGRAGRQGDPGSAQFFVSIEDELIRHNAPKAGAYLASRSASDEIRATRLVRAVLRNAQRTAEARARRNRASVLKQDDWIDQYMPGG